jgi:hypothetical protein
VTLTIEQPREWRWDVKDGSHILTGCGAREIAATSFGPVADSP